MPMVTIKQRFIVDVQFREYISKKDVEVDYDGKLLCVGIRNALQNFYLGITEKNAFKVREVKPCQT